MKTVTIHNKGPGMFTANLPHDVYCTRAGKCHCTVTNQVVLKIDKDTGAKTKGLKQRRVNGAIHIPAGKSLAGLHPFIKAVPEVKAAFQAGQITYEEKVQDAPEKKPGKQAPKASAETSEPQASGKKKASAKTEPEKKPEPTSEAEGGSEAKE